MNRAWAYLASTLIVGCVPAKDEGPSGAQTSGTLDVSCMGLVVDDDPLLAHSPIAYDDVGNQVHRCELHLKVTTPNNTPVIGPAYMRFFAEGKQWIGTTGYFTSSSGFQSGSFDFTTVVQEDCPECPTRTVKGEYSYCDLRNAQGCAFEACRTEVGACARELDDRLSKRLEIDFVPAAIFDQGLYELDLRMLGAGEATECRALRDPASGALQLEFQLGTFNGVEVAKLFGATCAKEQAARSLFRFRMGGVAGPGTFGPVTSVDFDGTRLPSVAWEMPYSFVAMRVPAATSCADHANLELDDNSSCTLQLGEKSFELVCERAVFTPPAGDVFPERFIPYWGIRAPPLMRGRLRIAGDCDYREKAQ